MRTDLDTFLLLGDTTYDDGAATVDQYRAEWASYFDRTTGLFDFATRDRWEGYATQRNEILAHIDDMAIPGVFWVAGDFYLASAQTIGRAGAGDGSEVHRETFTL